MSRTFEELAGEELDTLYQGAMFLSGGTARAAEALLVRSLRTAFHRFSERRPGEEAGRWLESWLVHTYLTTEAPGGSARPHRVRKPMGVRDGDLGALYAAAASLPAEARGALWLVLLRRWPYGAAAEALGVSPARLHALLKYRDRLFQSLMGRPDARDGTGHGRA